MGHRLVNTFLGEWLDVTIVQEYINKTPKFAKFDDVYYLGFGMGANAMIKAMSIHPKEFKKVKAIFLVKPYNFSDYVKFILNESNVANKTNIKI